MIEFARRHRWLVQQWEVRIRLAALRSSRRSTTLKSLSLNDKPGPTLVRVSPSVIYMDAAALQPSAFDRHCIPADLDYFVAVTHGAPVTTPTLEVVGSRLVVRSGYTFVSSAQGAIPRIDAITCQLYEKVNEASLLGCDITSPRAELDRCTGPVIHIICFHSSAASMRSTIDAMLSESLKCAAGKRPLGIAVPVHLSWIRDDHCIELRWDNPPSMAEIVALERVAFQIHESLCPIRSWNGMNVDYYR
jgi:hypothetical protein